MIIYHKNNVAGFAGNHTWYWPTQPIIQLHTRISKTTAAAPGRIMASIVAAGGLVANGGIAGIGGGLAG